MLEFQVNPVFYCFLSLARELCFTGRRFTAQEAKEFGFVRCVDSLQTEVNL